ncbi:MAG: hypothetical protein AB7N54_16915 [Alphaproteobacteria bacterium]
MLRRGGALVAALAFACALAAPAAAQQAVKVTFISGFAPNVTFTGAFTGAYVKGVEEALAKGGKYRIDWNMAHSGQVAKPRGEFEALQSGLGDIATVPTPYFFDRVPLYQTPYVTPFTTKEPGAIGDAYTAIHAKFPQFAAAWASGNQVALASTANADRYVLVSTVPLKTLADLKGKKIGGVGANLRWVTPVGATGVTQGLADFFNGLQTGLVTAVIGWPQAMGAFKLCEPAPHTLDPGFGASSVINLNANRDWFGKLPEDVRKALLDAGNIWHRDQLRLLAEGAADGIERCRRDFKMQWTDLSADETRQWAMALPPMALEWAAEMDKAALPGTAVLAAYMDSMRAAKQPVVRDWDKE